MQMANPKRKVFEPYQVICRVEYDGDFEDPAIEWGLVLHRDDYETYSYYTVFVLNGKHFRITGFYDYDKEGISDIDPDLSEQYGPFMAKELKEAMNSIDKVNDIQSGIDSRVLISL